MITRKTTKEHYDKYTAIWAKATKHTRHELSKQFYPKYKGKNTLELFKQDEHLNNIPLMEFDGYYGIMKDMIMRRSMSLAENTCYLKGLIFYLLEQDKLIKFELECNR